LFCSDDCRSWPREEKINNHGCWRKHPHILTMIIEESVCFMSCEPIFFCNYCYVVHTEYIYFFFINWTVRMSDNIPERVGILGHAHIICITVREDRIICCQIFCDLLLRSAFERICNVMQLILVKIKWHIKWKYLIQKFLHICLSYYFKCYRWSWYICHSTVCVLFNINFIWSNIEKWSDPNFAKSR
jgi:hypothetical protein